MIDHITKLRKQEQVTLSKIQSAERDIRGAEHELKKLWEELALKTPIEEAGKLWRHFKNFAEYKDLKSLYNKVVPEIDKHQTHMEEHRDEIRRFGEIMLRFDEVMSDKASKSEVSLFEQRVRDQYLGIALLDEVKNATKDSLSKIADRQERIETNMTLMSQSVQKEV